ncbi:hypothetical protein AVP41_02556 [Microbacterium sp. TNHR37B]|nr:hypothetical protein AVP41_02556 [Microbacterium sp. TNHR37B]
MALAVAVLAGGAVWAAPAASAGAATERPAAAPDGSLARVDFRAAARADGVVRSDGRLLVSLSVTNAAQDVVEPGTVELAVSRTPLTSRKAVEAWTSGDSSPALRRVGTETIGTVGPYGSASASTAVEVGDDLAPGAYALRATYRSPAGEIERRSVWVVPDDAPAAGRVAVIVPVTAGPLSEGLLTSDELATLTAEGGSLRAQLDAVRGTSAILAVDPAIAAAIRVLGTAAPETAQTWLADLLALPNDRFALQFGDADLAAQYAAGLSEPLTVETLSSYIDPATVVDAEAEEDADAQASPDDAGSTTAGAGSPSPTPGPDGVVLPTIDELLDIGAARDDVFWPAAGTAEPGLLEMLSGGAEGSLPLTLVPSDTIAGSSKAGDGQTRADVGGAQVLVYDSDVTTALRRASNAVSTIDRDEALATASAFATFTDADVPLLVTIDRGRDRSEEALRATIRTAASLDGREPGGMMALMASPNGDEVSLAAGTDDDARARTLERFLAGEEKLAAFATILEDPTLITGPERARVLQLLGNGWRGNDEWSVAVATHATDTQATLDAVSIVRSPDINLLGASAPLAFSVRNDLPWPVSLVLAVEPRDPRIVVQDTTAFTAGAAQATRVDVPVEARVGNGDSSLSLQLWSPSLVKIGGSVTIDVAVRAEWETIGVVVMSVLVATFIILGLIRTVVRIRRRRRVAPSDPAPATEATTHG